MAAYQDRQDAGRRLASLLMHHQGDPNLQVLALPRGGVPVAYEIAVNLSAPLDLMIVRKLGAPSQPELAIGAIASQGEIYLNQPLISQLGITSSEVERVRALEQAECQRRERRYRAGRPPLVLENKTVILVDDGAATGATMRVAIQVARQQQAHQIIVALPVAAPSVCQIFAKLTDEVICPIQPDNLYAVGAWYDDFTQTTDAEVIQLLAND